MFMQMLKDYEVKTVEPRHRETQSELAAIKALVQQGEGAIKLGGVIFSIASFLWIVLQVVSFVGTHK